MKEAPVAGASESTEGPAAPGGRAGASLVVEELSVRFDGEEGPVRALDGVSFSVPPRTTVALVGESGCGKSVTARAIMRLIRSPPGHIDGGRVMLGDVDLLALSERRMRAIRGERIALIFQDPGAALNPVYSVGFQVSEALRIRGQSAAAAKRRAVELLERVGLPGAAHRYRDYPHELSGGMQQRVMIATALAAEPELLIADEPTTALDMLAAAQINTLLSDLKREHDMSMLLISHDIAAVAENADEIVVLYAGRVMERGQAEVVLGRPQHPYTRGLLESIPPLRRKRRRRRKTPTRLPVLAGAASDVGAGCRFAPRCPEVFARCLEEEPTLYAADEAVARCFLVEQGARPIELRRPREPVPEAPYSRSGDAAEEKDELRAADSELEAALSGESDLSDAAEEAEGARSQGRSEAIDRTAAQPSKPDEEP